jgi:hypothetical protein
LPRAADRTLFHPGSSSSSGGDVAGIASFWGGDVRLRTDDIVDSLFTDFRRGGECNEDANDICGGPKMIESPPRQLSKVERGEENT